MNVATHQATNLRKALGLTEVEFERWERRIAMTPEEWIISGDTGVSSKTIWAVMMGIVPDNPPPFQFNVPLDPSDFGRCFRLLEQIPEWRDMLYEVAETFPEWGPMVREWDKMTDLYKRDYPLGKSTELYDLMQDLKHKGMRDTGWVETNPGSWHKDGE